MGKGKAMANKRRTSGTVNPASSSVPALFSHRFLLFFFRQGKGCVEKSGKIEGKKKKCDRDKERSNEALSKLSPGDAALVSVSGA